MKRAAALALLAGVGVGGWWLWTRSGIGPAPTADSSLDALASYRPTELRAELASIDYARTAGAQLAERGMRADGPMADGSTTPAERRVLAESECRRASSEVGMPAWAIPECIAALKVEPSWTYQDPGARVALRVDLGYGGLEGYSSIPQHVARRDADGRPIVPPRPAPIL